MVDRVLQLLEECTDKLGLHKAARRLFLDDGREVLSEEDIERDAEVYVSTGEPFRNPIKDILRMSTHLARLCLMHHIIINCHFPVSGSLYQKAF